MEAETSTGIYVSAGAISAISAALTLWIKSFFAQKTKVEPTPLPVEGKIQKAPGYATYGEFNQRCSRIESDIAALRSEINAGNAAVIQKLDEIDSRSEQRAVDLNRRIDPLIAKVAANSEAVEFIKAAARTATIGGRK